LPLWIHVNKKTNFSLEGRCADKCQHWHLKSRIETQQPPSAWATKYPILLQTGWSLSSWWHPYTPIHRHPDPIPEKIEKFHNGVYNYPAVLSGNVLKNNLRTVCIQFGSFSTTRREQTGTEVAAPTVLMWNPKSFLRKTSVPLHTDTGTNRIGSHF